MLLTLYYMAATWIQSYKLRSVSAKLSKFINDQMSIVFFNVQDDVNGKLPNSYHKPRISGFLYFYKILFNIDFCVFFFNILR